MNVSESSITDKWGENACSLGWVSIPTLLLFSQRELNITPSELNVLMNLFMHWWNRSEKPFPSQEAIAYRAGISLKTVQRALNDLEEKNLIAKIPTPRSNLTTKGRNLYDLNPLIEKLDKVSVKVLSELSSRKNMVYYVDK